MIIPLEGSSAQDIALGQNRSWKYWSSFAVCSYEWHVWKYKYVGNVLLPADEFPSKDFIGIGQWQAQLLKGYVCIQ